MTTRTDERKQFLIDVFTTALEGGIGYWSAASEYHWMANPEAGTVEQDFDGFYAVIESTEGDWEGDKRIDRDVIVRGLAKIMEPGFNISPDIRASIRDGNIENDAGEIDSIGADCIVQAGLFGEVVYG